MLLKLRWNDQKMCNFVVLLLFYFISWRWMKLSHMNISWRCQALFTDKSFCDTLYVFRQFQQVSYFHIKNFHLMCIFLHCHCQHFNQHICGQKSFKNTSINITAGGNAFIVGAQIALCPGQRIIWSRLKLSPCLAKFTRQAI